MGVPGRGEGKEENLDYLALGRRQKRRTSIPSTSGEGGPKHVTIERFSDLAIRRREKDG